MIRTAALPVLLMLTVAPVEAAVTELQFGRFVISVSDSWTAQVFHMVDQLSHAVVQPSFCQRR